MPIYWGNTMTALASGFRAFSKRMVTPPATPGEDSSGAIGFDDFGSWDYRFGRYNLFWSYYANNAYDSAVLSSEQYKAQFGLYKFTRGAYNPLFRLGEMWGNHTWGGQLNAGKVNGRVPDTAIPILTANEALRPAIDRLWRDSNWQENKDMTARIGAVKGDVGLRVEDDLEAGKVRIQPVDPATIRWVREDRQGNVDAYMLQERRIDPKIDLKSYRFGQMVPLERTVTYTEYCYRDGRKIHFETYLNGELYPWNGDRAQYDVAYGFVPFVLHPHFKVYPNYPWGWSEYQAALAKAREVDDIGSKLHDQIRKAADPKWWVAGAQPPRDRSTVKVQGDRPTDDNPEPGKQELAFFYGGMGSTVVPLMFNLDIQFTSAEVQNQLKNLENDYPEIRYDALRVSGDASAKALREVRKTAEAKFHARRAGYDRSLNKVHQMAIAIGGWRGYDGYEGFGLESYDSGALDHEIGNRSVFLMDPLDKIEEEQAFFMAMQTATQAGMPAVTFLRRNDWTEEEIQEFLRDKQEQDAKMLAQTQALQATKAPAPAPTNR